MAESKLSFSAKVWYCCTIITGVYTAKKTFEFIGPSMLAVSTLALLTFSISFALIRKLQKNSQPRIIYLFDNGILIVSLTAFLNGFGGFFIGRAVSGIFGYFIMMN